MAAAHRDAGGSGETGSAWRRAVAPANDSPTGAHADIVMRADPADAQQERENQWRDGGSGNCGAGSNPLL